MISAAFWKGTVYMKCYKGNLQKLWTRNAITGPASMYLLMITTEELWVLAVLTTTKFL